MSFWEGYIGTLYDDFSEDEIKDVSPTIFEINKKLEKILSFTSIKEIKRYARNLLSEHERNYINSKIFDNLMQSIQEQDPLFTAVKRDAYKICELYLSLDAKNFCDLEEALDTAVYRGNLEITKLLLNNGAMIRNSTLVNKGRNEDVENYFKSLGF